jgi:hypothetical protein
METGGKTPRRFRYRFRYKISKTDSVFEIYCYQWIRSKIFEIGFRNSEKFRNRFHPYLRQACIRGVFCVSTTEWLKKKEKSCSNVNHPAPQISRREPWSHSIPTVFKTKRYGSGASWENLGWSGSVRNLLIARWFRHSVSEYNFPF